MMSIKNFVETIRSCGLSQPPTSGGPTNTKKLTVILDNKLYPNEYGINVRPLRVKYGSTILDMKQLIELFGKVPYISVKESRYRSLYREPMLMTIDLTPKTYEDHIYYDYYIDKLFLRSELNKYIKIEKNAYDEIKKFKENQSNVVSEEIIENYRTLDEN